MIQTKSHFILFVAVIFFLFFSACETSTTGNSTDASNKTENTAIGLDDSLSNSRTNQPTITDTNTPDCIVPGERLEDNDFKVPNSNLLVSIVADSTTMDTEFGASYRIFQVYDLSSCLVKYREVLPINFSPDYPYYLSLESYSTSEQIVCTPGYDLLYCFDLKAMKPLPKMKSNQQGDTEDAQSGMPIGVVNFKDFMIGYTINLGGYAFDLRNREKPVELAPAALYTGDDEEVNTLFFLPDQSGGYRAVMTLVDNEGRLQAKDLFEKNLDINPNLPANIRDNRFVIFREKSTDKKLAIDMQVQEAVNLPESISSQPVQEILKWIKSR